jgi:PAS domain S-box-containing protein
MRNERFGIVMIAASLAAIAAVVYLMLAHQATARRGQVREQGASLVRLLSRLPQDQLVPKGGNIGLFQAALGGNQSAELSYGAIVDIQGMTLAEITSAGSTVPPAPPPVVDGIHFGERRLAAPGEARRVTEFYGPLLDNGRVTGQVRVGFLDADPGLPGAEQLPFIALLALPVFMLVPLFHFMLKREMRPLGEIGGQLRRLAESGGAPVAELKLGDDLRDFAQRFGSFVGMMQQRLRAVEAERFDSTLNQRMLAYRQEKVESVLHALPEAILVLDESGVVTYANAKLDPILGLEHASLAGRPVAEIGAGADLVAFLERCKAHPGHAFRGETLELSPPAQPERRILASAYPLFSPRDAAAVLGVLVVFRDVTAEMLARRAGAEFVSHVSHELKSPLNVLRMYSELLLDGSQESDETRLEAVNVIHDETERMGGLINNLLNIARLETGTVSLNRQRVRLRDLLEDIFAEVSRNAAGKDVRCELDLPPDLGSALIDKDLLRIAVVNLLGNAIKYNRKGGSVTLSAEETDTQVLVRVRDTGIGIPPEDQPKVFEKFFRSADAAAKQAGGHGLGLFLVRQITELHQGTVTVASEPGQGSEFCMQIRKVSAMLQEAARI